MKTKDFKAISESRGARVMRNAKAAETRRKACARRFRARLLAEVPGDGVARESLIEAAVSAHVEVTELSQRFYQCRANEDAMSRLSLARGQLARILRQLGLVTGPVEPVEEHAGAALEEWASNHRSRQQAPVASDCVPSVGHDDAPVVEE
jgi:hypothetical protein